MPGKDEIERRCALTHEVKPAAELVRFVVGPDGVLVPDTDARAEGRGVWISLGESKIAEAVTKKAFAQSLKGEVAIPDDLPEIPIAPGSYRAVALLTHAKLATSNAEATRKIKEKAVDVGEEKRVEDLKKEYVIDRPTVLRLGRKFVRLVPQA